MEDITEYRWGILRIAGHAGFVQGMIDKYLPPQHTILSSRDTEDPLYREYLVSGPDMPVVSVGATPPTVDLEFGVDECGPYCYWAHVTNKRWPAHPDMQTLMAD